jgi:hypothetical protein
LFNQGDPLVLRDDNLDQNKIDYLLIDCAMDPDCNLAQNYVLMILVEVVKVEGFDEDIQDPDRGWDVVLVEAQDGG